MFTTLQVHMHSQR